VCDLKDVAEAVADHRSAGARRLVGGLFDDVGAGADRPIEGGVGGVDVVDIDIEERGERLAGSPSS